MKQALLSSIHKWNKVVRGGPDNATEDCALCQLYLEDSCRGCPVSKDTGEISCIGSPYDDWSVHQEHYHATEPPPYRKRKGCTECSRLAKAQRDYLKTL